MTLLATLTPNGFGPGFQFPGALDRTVFDAFVAQVLVQSLRPGQTVVLDHLNVHKSAIARRLIEEAGCELRFLSTCSPVFNPIEQVFAKLRHHLRQAEARSVDAILTATRELPPRITRADATAFYRDAGYNL